MINELKESIKGRRLVYCVIDFLDHDHGEKKFLNHDHELLFQLESRLRQSRLQILDNVAI